VKCTVTINVQDTNEAPTIRTCGPLTVEEKVVSGTMIGSPLTATDPDMGQSLRWTFLTASPFGITCDGQVIVKTGGSSLDYTVKNRYSISVKVTDDDAAAPLSDTCTLIINVLDKNEPPVVPDLQTFYVNENVAAGTVITTAVTASDIDKNTLS